MLNKSHPLSRCKSNSGKNNKKNVFYISNLMLGSMTFAIDTIYNFATNFLQ